MVSRRLNWKDVPNKSAPVFIHQAETSVVSMLPPGESIQVYARQKDGHGTDASQRKNK